MGEVRRVLDPVLERTLALKSVQARLRTASAWRRFVTEARLTARLQHPGVPPVHELGWLPDGRPYFTLQEVRGQTLRRLLGLPIGEDGVPSRRQLVDAVRRAADAVGYAHSVGVIHRDIKPDNIMLGPFGEVWVLDWGLAVELTYASEHAQPAEGTPLYMAPEQARGGPLDARTDVYALGATLYEVINGAPPSGPDPQCAGTELDAVCLRALSSDPASRPIDELRS